MICWLIYSGLLYAFCVVSRSAPPGDWPISMDIVLGTYVSGNKLVGDRGSSFSFTPDLAWKTQPTAYSRPTIAPLDLILCPLCVVLESKPFFPGGSMTNDQVFGASISG